MKHFYFIVVFVIVFLLGGLGYKLFFQKEQIHTKQLQEARSYTKYLLEVANIPALFDASYASLSNGWSLYINNMFYFSMETPNNMNPGHMLRVWEQGEKEYRSYSVIFTDRTSRERILNMFIQEKPLASLEEYIAQRSENVNLIKGEMNLSGIRAITMLSPYYASDLQKEEDRERRVLFIRDGFLFEIFMRSMPLEDIDHVLKSFQFL